MTATIFLVSLPKSTFIGIDLLTFASSPRFLGITGIPPGWHFLYTSPTTSLSIRHGTWFHVGPSPQSLAHTTLIRRVDDEQGYNYRPTSEEIYVLKWETEREELLPVIDQDEVERWRARLKQRNDVGRRVREGLFPYRQTATSTPSYTTNGRPNPDTRDGGSDSMVEESSDWPNLTSHISISLLKHLTTPPSGSLFCNISTTSCAPQDHDAIPGLSEQDMRQGLFGSEERELHFLGIDLRRTWREGAVGRERTEGARDRSWALDDVVQRNEGLGEGEWGWEILGEMQICFLMVLTLSNYSCLEEWKRILALVLTSRSAITTHARFFASFLSLLHLQLRHCNDVEGGLFDVNTGGDGNFLLELLRGFKRGLEDVFGEDQREEIGDAMDEVEEWVKREWGWELGNEWLRRGMVELEDGERVEVEVADMEGEDERGEYAPVIVEL
jgi:A1 cistron-splicing factor AAR2